jgi:hypothetical protein
LLILSAGIEPWNSGSVTCQLFYQLSYPLLADSC